MRKNLRKMLVVVLVVCMLFSLMACSKEDKKKDEVKEKSTKEDEIDRSEFITIDVFSAGANYQGIQSGFFGKMLKDKFNLELNIIAPNVAGGGDALYQTRSATGNLGDIVIVPKEKMKDCIDAGIILDVTDMFNKTQNLKKYDYATKAFNEYAGVDSNKVYAMAAMMSSFSPLDPNTEDGAPYVGSFMRLDYYNELGNPEMNNYEDMLNVLKQMQDMHPTTEDGNKIYPFSLFGDWDGDYMMYASKFLFMYGYDEGKVGFCFPNALATEYTHVAEDNGPYYNALKMLYDANKMGLVDPDSSSQNWDTVFAKMENGQTLFSLWPWLAAGFNKPENKIDGKVMSFIPVADQQLVVDGYNIYGDAVIAIGAETKYPERIMELLDWMCTPEAAYASDGCDAGVRGLTYDIIDGRPALTEFGIQCKNDPQTVIPEEYGGGTFRDGQNMGHFAFIPINASADPETGEVYLSSQWKSERERLAGPAEEMYKQTFGTTNAMEYLSNNNLISVAPGCNFNRSVDSSEMAMKRTQCGDIIVDASWQMVFAKDENKFNSIWENMKSQLEGLGYDEVLAKDAADIEVLRQARAKAIEDAK